MWILFALLTAFFGSLSDVFGKKVVGKVDIYVASWAWVFFSLPLTFLIFTFNEPTPLGPYFLRTLFFSSVTLVLASLFYFKALKESDLSLVMPMMAFTPVLLLITSPIMVGEFPSLVGLFGIILIVIGSYVLNLKERSKGYLAPFKALVDHRGTRCMLVVAVLFSVTANLDKIGIQNSSVFTWILILNLVLSVVFSIIMFIKSKDFLLQIKSVWPWLIFLGLANSLLLIFNMITLQMTIVPYLIAVKRTSILISSLFGFILFKEKGVKERLGGVLLMLLGVLLICFS